MKKILGISLCALFAVSAANADIASKLYVDQQVGGIDISGIGTNTAAITTLKGRVDGHDTSISTNTTNIGTNTAAITALKGRVDGHDTSISTNTTNIGTNTAAIADINSDIGNMNLTETTGDYVKVVSQANGTVSATGASFATDVATGNTNAPTSAAVVTYVDGKVRDLDVGALTNRVSANEGNIATNTSDIATNANAITDLDNTIQGLNQDRTEGQYVTFVKQSGGQVTAEGASFATNVAEDVEAGGTNAPTTAAVASYVEGKVGALDSDIENMDLPQTTGNYVKVVSQANGTVSATGASFEAEVNSRTIDNAPTSAAVATYVTNNAVNTVATGGTNGTILVDNQEVAVRGLDDLAYKATIANDDVAEGAAIASSKIAFDDTQTTVFGSGINSNLVADINNSRTTINAMIGEGTGYDTCKTSTYGCTLVVKNGRFTWEAVTRATGEQ